MRKVSLLPEVAKGILSAPDKSVFKPLFHTLREGQIEAAKTVAEMKEGNLMAFAMAPFEVTFYYDTDKEEILVVELKEA